MRRASEEWSGEGTLVFTSSSGVYAEENGGVVTEKGIVGAGERRERLLAAEDHVLERGGCVVRLAGLYDRFVGAHNFWLSVAEVR